MKLLSTLLAVVTLVSVAAQNLRGGDQVRTDKRERERSLVVFSTPLRPDKCSIVSQVLK